MPNVPPVLPTIFRRFVGKRRNIVGTTARILLPWGSVGKDETRWPLEFDLRSIGLQIFAVVNTIFLSGHYRGCLKIGPKHVA